MDVPDRTLQLVLHYDGAGFAGWQRQREARTVQGVLESALTRLTQRYVPVLGAGAHRCGGACTRAGRGGTGHRAVDGRGAPARAKRRAADGYLGRRRDRDGARVPRALQRGCATLHLPGRHRCGRVLALSSHPRTRRRRPARCRGPPCNRDPAPRRARVSWLCRATDRPGARRSPVRRLARAVDRAPGRARVHDRGEPVSFTIWSDSSWVPCSTPRLGVGTLAMLRVF